VRESAARFGKDAALVGVVCEPATESGYRARPAVLLLNAGLIHRVGPSRLYVRLARALAAQGFLTMRFDLSGRGDSDARPGVQSTAMDSLADVQAAMDLLEQSKNVSRFIVAGVCSGAVAAAEAARVDRRIAGAVLISAYAYPTVQSRIRHYLRRLGKPKRWWNTLAGRNELGRALRRALFVRGGVANEGEMTDDTTGARSRQAAAVMFREMIARGVCLFVIHPGGDAYNYRRQFEDAFSDVNFEDKLAVEYVPQADHTFTRLLNQQRLQDAIVGWARSRFQIRVNETPDPAPESPPTPFGLRAAAESSR